MKILTIILFIFISSSIYGQNHKWEKEEVKAYMDACVESAKETIGEQEAYNYCDCTLRKVEKKYPNPIKLTKVSEKKKNKFIMKIAQECIKNN